MSSRRASHAKHTPAADYTFTEERYHVLVLEVERLPEDDILAFPGRLQFRIRWSGTLQIAAVRDSADLIQAPMTPPLTLAEIEGQRDRIELLRAAESRFQALRIGRKQQHLAFDELAAQATQDRDLLLRAFDLLFANDPRGQKRLSAIRAGEGDADLVQDVSDILHLCDEHADFLARCPRGEAKAAARLRKLSPKLSHLLGAKGIDDELRRARRLRNGAYTLMMQTERRLRDAAYYWYRGTDKMKDYAAYVPPRNPTEPTDEGDTTDALDSAEGEATDTIAPEPAATEPAASAPEAAPAMPQGKASATHAKPGLKKTKAEPGPADAKAPSATPPGGAPDAGSPTADVPAA